MECLPRLTTFGVVVSLLSLVHQQGISGIFIVSPSLLSTDSGQYHKYIYKRFRGSAGMSSGE